MTGLKAITLSQPHATLVDLQKKKLETRGWRTSYRGYLVIHSSKIIKPDFRACFSNPVFQRALAGRTINDVPLGCGLCVVKVLACVKTTELHKLKAINFSFDKDEITFGDYRPNRWAWALQHLGSFEAPIPAPGALSLWDWPDDVKGLPPL